MVRPHVDGDVVGGVHEQEVGEAGEAEQQAGQHVAQLVEAADDGEHDDGHHAAQGVVARAHHLAQMDLEAALRGGERCRGRFLSERLLGDRLVVTSISQASNSSTISSNRRSNSNTSTGTGTSTSSISRRRMTRKRGGSDGTSGSSRSSEQRSGSIGRRRVVGYTSGRTA